MFSIGRRVSTSSVFRDEMRLGKAARVVA